MLILIGTLYPLGFSPFDFWPLTIVSLLLLVNEIVDSIYSSSKDKLSLFSTGLFWSFGAFGLGTSWVYVSIHNFGHAPVIGAVAISFLFVLTLSVVKGLGVAFIGRLVHFFGKGLLLLIIPFAWIISEFMQTFLFSGFPWLFAGYTQIDGPLSLLSTWLGVYGVSWFMLIIVSCLVIWFRSDCEKSQQASQQPHYQFFIILIILLSIPLLSSNIAPPIYETDKKSIKVALVQPNISQDIKWDRRYFLSIMDILYNQSRENWNVDLMVWPEGAIPAYKHQVNEIIERLNEKSKKTQTDLLLGIPVYDEQEKTSFASFISLGNNQQTYHKQVLVPFGEYVPFSKILRGLIEFFNLPMSNFSPATRQQKPMIFSDYQVIPAICYEITYPSIVHDLIARADNQSSQAKLIVTVSNDAWFGDSLGPYQHMQMARMRALESGLPLVRATNDGITLAVDARGQVLKSLKRSTQDTLVYDLSLTSYNTLYRQYGLLGIYLILILSFIIFLVQWFLLRKK